MRCIKILIVSLIVCGSATASVIPPESELPWSKINFKVLIGDKRDLEYCRGEEAIKLNAGTLSKRTKYFKASEPTKVLQEENVRFELSSLNVVDYEFRNHATGESVDLKMPQAPQVQLNYVAPVRQGKVAEEVTTKWTWSPSTIIGKTLHHFTVRQWKALIGGNKPKFELFVPMKRESYGFQLRQGKVYDPGNGSERRVIHLEPSSWAIRQFVPEMAFHYEVFDGVPRLIVYEGASTIAINGEENKLVRIEFDYQK